jgi:hypothetical protein
LVETKLAGLLSALLLFLMGINLAFTQDYMKSTDIKNSSGQGGPRRAERISAVKERMDPMSEFIIYPVGSAGSDYARSAANSVEHTQKAASPDLKSPVSMHSFPGNTRLVFKVDEAKNEVVVMIIDETSSEVIRTVPGNAMKDLPSGGLIEKNA